MTTTTSSISPPALALVTPEMAQEWLDTTNGDNRHLRPVWVDALAREITEGRWMMTGDPIRFDLAGTLIDGQHRLNAIVKAKVTVPLFVMRGLETAVRDVIDTNVPRTAGDTLHFAGYTNTVAIAAAARVAMGRRDGLIRTGRDTRAGRYTNSAVLEFVSENPALAEVVHAVKASARTLHVTSAAAWSYSMWVLTTLNPTAAAEFESSLVESRTDGAGDARLAFIRFFSGRELQKTPSRYAIPETVFATFRAWNGWRQGEHVKRITPVTGATTAGSLIPTPVA